MNTPTFEIITGHHDDALVQCLTCLHDDNRYAFDYLDIEAVPAWIEQHRQASHQVEQPALALFV